MQFHCEITLTWVGYDGYGLDLVFLDAPFPALGKSDVEGIFDPPYFEWFQANQNFTEYTNVEECLAYIEDYMIKNGPFDGFLGSCSISCTAWNAERWISSGAKFGWSKFGHHKLTRNAFSSPLECPSLHIIGEMDFMKPESTVLVQSFVDPFVINHPKGHSVPSLDEKSTEVMLGFIERIQKTIATDDEQICSSAET
ncbi:hypothetical protein V6N11_040856 [Hibiscus sabdariffa]|uniref:Serine hydrolase domain-containing protein n=1 Tax=Hibiscus sabdariffa TaxID=183260 RepID=A0ABR2RIT0_9ROSI